MACLWNLEDTYYLVNNKPCSFFDGSNGGLMTIQLSNINESYLTTNGATPINLIFAGEDNGVYTDCCIIPNHFAIFKTELTAKTYMGAIIDAHKAHIETFRPEV
jgi:hypothetical protein